MGSTNEKVLNSTFVFADSRYFSNILEKTSGLDQVRQTVMFD